MSFIKLTDLDLAGKRVLIRADLNVPVKDGKVTSDARISASTFFGGGSGNCTCLGRLLNPSHTYSRAGFSPTSRRQNVSGSNSISGSIVTTLRGQSSRTNCQ